jgi:hypothetical protein
MRLAILAEQTDLVMQMLETGPRSMLRADPAPQPIGQPTWIGMQAGYGNQGAPFSPMASPPLALQVGRVGFAALQALGAAGAAALAAILESYRNRLGRLPSPNELDSALQEQAAQRDHSRQPVMAQPQELGKRRRPNYDDECQRLFDGETAICSQVTQTLGKHAGTICHQSAMQRYAECLRDGVNGVRTPLTIVTY